MTTSAIILAAGRSTRMKSPLPKVLHALSGRTLLEWVLRAARAAGAERVVAVVSPDHRDAVAEALEKAGCGDVELAVQAEAKGTAHAILAAKSAFAEVTGTSLVLLGDAPLVRPEALRALLAEHAERRAVLSILTGVVDDPAGYGRIVRGVDGDVETILEHKDASAEVRAIQEINSGVFALELPAGFAALERVEPSAETGELYATRVVDLLLSEQRTPRAVHAVPAADAEDVLGVNTQVQLAEVGELLRERINRRHQLAGVTLVDPKTAHIDDRAEVAPGARIEPFVVIEGASVVEAGAVVGPFAHVRGGSVVGAGARVGNFVEVVRSRVGAGARALHLSYVGDAEVGEGANVGAGTVFANYDGERHHRSAVEAGASLGANTVLVGPSRVGAGGKTGAGAVVRGEVPRGETWVGVPARRVRSEGGES